jgi:hypothetical protein
VKRRISWRQAKARIGAVAPKEKKYDNLYAFVVVDIKYIMTFPNLS